MGVKMLKIIGLKTVLKDIFILFFTSVFWRAFVLSKRDKEMIDEFNAWKYPTDEYIEKRKGKTSALRSKTLLRIRIEYLQKPIHEKIVSNYEIWKWFFGKNWKWFIRQTFKKHICKHKKLSEPQWEFSKQQGYRYCYNCWTEFYDPTLSFDKCNCVSEISA